MTKNTGGAAFPFHVLNNSGADVFGPNGSFIANGVEAFSLGMTLRDYFAAKALGGFAQASMNNDWPYNSEAMAKEAYEWADAMLAAREVQHD